MKSLFGDGRFRSVNTQAGTRKVEQTWIVNYVGWWHHGVACADVYLQRDPDFPEHRHQSDAHAAVLLPLADRLDAAMFFGSRFTGRPFRGRAA